MCSMKGSIYQYWQLFELFYNDVNHVVVIMNDIFFFILRILRTCFSLTGVSWLLIALLMATVCRNKKELKSFKQSERTEFLYNFKCIFNFISNELEHANIQDVYNLLINIITIIKHKKQHVETSISSIMSCN